ncbi:MAG: AsmA-like C-terminal region-containing protein, partial [Candidatus Gastranaerophilales bacterium]|nr:AsmA-like C-terminal region-containing protein [Candidatus Gastranaerophilales bacterium]
LLELFADKLDKDNLIKNASYIHKTTEGNNERKNIELPNICLNKGHFNVKQFIIKSLNVNNFTGDFSIDKNGIFNAENVNAEVGQGNMYGKFSYNLNNTDMNANFELNNVDSNYVAETLFDAKNQIYGSGSGKIILKTTGLTNEEIIKNLEGLVYFEIFDGRMPRLGSIEYLLRAGNIIKSGITGFTINSILELLNLVKTGYFSNINGGCTIENGVAKNIEIFSTGENMSLYIHGSYDIAQTNADMEILGKLSNKISTIFGAIGNTSLNTFFKLIPGISLLDFGRKNFIEDVEKIPSFTNGDYDSRVFQAIVRGNINSSNSVESFKWVK